MYISIQFITGTVCMCGRYNVPESLCQCPKECDCENRQLIRNFKKMQIHQLPRNQFSEKSIGVGCSWEHKKVEGVKTAKTECTCHANKKDQPPYYVSNSNNNVKCKNCHCGNNMKDRGKKCPR